MSDKKGVSAGCRGTWIEIDIFADVWYGVVQVMVWVGYGDGYGTARVGAGGEGGGSRVSRVAKCVLQPSAVLCWTV